MKDLLIKFAVILCSVVPPTVNGETMVPAKKIEQHFEIIGKLDSKRTRLFEKLQKRFGKKSHYSADEIVAIELPLEPNFEVVEFPRPQRNLPVPVDAFPADRVEEHFQMLRLVNPKSKASKQILEAKYGVQPWYLATELRDVEANGAETPPAMVPRTKTPVVEAAEAAAANSQPPILKNWKSPLIRKDWTDVLFDEDPSQDGIQSKTMDDLVGATFAYTNDREADSETWSTIGALIIPWFHEGAVNPGLMPSRFGIAPSVSLNRISTNGKPSTEVDYLLYRLGLYAEWYELVPGLTDLQLRAAIAYGTDSAHDAEMTGFELDLEPRMLMGQEGGEDVWYKIGFRNTLWRKAPLLEDGSDQSLLDYQLRVWLHVEGGDIQNVGKSWVAVPDNFLRLGPTAQFRLDMPRLWRGFSISAQYSALPTIDGPRGPDSLFKVDATLNLLRDRELHRRLSINAGYVNGGMNFTKQEVEAFTLGMSVLF